MIANRSIDGVGSVFSGQQCPACGWHLRTASAGVCPICGPAPRGAPTRPSVPESVWNLGRPGHLPHRHEQPRGGGDFESHVTALTGWRVFLPPINRPGAGLSHCSRDESEGGLGGRRMVAPAPGGGAGAFHRRVEERFLAGLITQRRGFESRPGNQSSSVPLSCSLAARVRPAAQCRYDNCAGALHGERSCPRPTGRTISKRPCDWRGLSAADGPERRALHTSRRSAFGRRGQYPLSPFPRTPAGRLVMLGLPSHLRTPSPDGFPEAGCSRSRGRPPARTRRPWSRDDRGRGRHVPAADRPAACAGRLRDCRERPASFLSRGAA